MFLFLFLFLLLLLCPCFSLDIDICNSGPPYSTDPLDTGLLRALPRRLPVQQQATSSNTAPQFHWPFNLAIRISTVPTPLEFWMVLGPWIAVSMVSFDDSTFVLVAASAHKPSTRLASHVECTPAFILLGGSLVHKGLSSSVNTVIGDKRG